MVRLARLAGALTVLLGLVAVAPSPAWAGCGHFVVSASGHVRFATLSDLELLRLPDETQPEGNPTVPLRDVPCSGPSCSQGPGAPHAPAPLPSVRSDQWCCTTVLPPLTSPPLEDVLPNQSHRHLLHITDPAERPPRFLAGLIF
jgi:hypothetical protein